MAKVIENPKGFKVIQCTKEEVKSLGGFGICDFCYNESNNGYYISVLNCWYCPKCYKRFIGMSTRYKEDIDFEEENFKTYKKLLHVQ